MDTSTEEVLSQRGKQKFPHNGFLFVFEKRSKRDQDLLFWRCDHVGRCGARIHTKHGTVVKELNIHSHNPCAASVEVAKVTTKIKVRAATTMENPSVIINEVLANTSQGAQGSMPRAAAMKKIVRRKRKAISAAPPDPLNLMELTVPNVFQVYELADGENEDFLLSDSGPGEERILIFGRKTWLQHLVTSDMWYCDGTFKVAPNLFSQVYVILCEKLHSVIPVIYALLPNKKRDTYSRLFSMLKVIAPTLAPKSVVCDYEQAVILAMQESFPGVAIKGCFFHLSQNFQRKIASTGYATLYQTNSDFALKAKMLLAISFVPIDRIDEYFDVILEQLSDEHTTLAEWFEDNYLGRVNRRGTSRRRPLFPPALWNLYERTLNGENRTNNHAEAANRKLQVEFGMEHPTIWKFIRTLHKIQKSRDTFLEQLIAGHAPPLKLKKYRDADDRLQNIVLNIDERTPLEFLRGIAHNFK